MELDLNYIKGTLTRILSKTFASVPQKRNILEYDNRFNFACPYCRDSEKSLNEKRGNLFFDRLFYVCFNCDYKTTFDKLLKDNNEIIDPLKKLEIINYIDSQISNSDLTEEEVKMEDLIPIDELTDAINKSELNISDFGPIIPNKGVYKYLISRGIGSNLHNNIFQAKYWRNADDYEYVICMLNRSDLGVLGMQIRNLKKGRNRMFKIYNYENLLEIVDPNKLESFDLNKLALYNKLSYYFNILNIDIFKPVHVFEGYLDSLFFPNSIGMIGVNTDVKFIENSLDVKYVFDNDLSGNRKAVIKLKENKTVFLWSRMFHDIAKNKKDYRGVYYRISNIKDVNALNMTVPNAYRTLNMAKYFSRDVLDIIDIPVY